MSSNRVLRNRATLKSTSNAANLTKEAEAQGLADALNRSIRLNEPYEDADGEFVKRIYDKHAADIRFLVNETASSCWTAGFNHLLRRCIYIRSQPVPVDKESLRTEAFKCVACGRFEYCNPRTVDVFGFMKEDEEAEEDLLLHPADEAAAEFESIAHWMDVLWQQEPEVGQLARFDLGRLTMGETCHARFNVVMQLRNLLFDKYCMIRDEIDERTSDGSIEAIESKQYGDSKEDAAEYIQRRAALECALSKLKPPFPPSQPTKQVFDLVDLARAEASGGDDDALHALLRRRTHLELGGMPKRRRVDEDEEEEGGQGPRAEVVGDEEEGASPPPPRRRSRVIDDDEEEEGAEGARAEVVGDEEEDASPPPPPPRRRSRVIDEDDEEEEEEWEEVGGGDDGGGGEGGSVPGAAAQARDRRAPLAVARLASRHKVLVNALRLAATLQAQGYTSESATVTNLVCTCQELMDKYQP